MKTLKLLGIIALSALIVFWAIGCDLLGEEEELEGIVTIQTTINGAFVGEVLTVAYNGTDVSLSDATFQWYREMTPGNYQTTFTGANDGKGPTFTPTTTGNYQVDVIIEGYAPKRAQNPVNVAARPEYFTLFGTWDMFAVDNGQWKADAIMTRPTNEVVVITNTSFRLESTFEGYTSAANYTRPGVGVAQATVDKFDLNAPFEFLEYTITGWEALTTGLPEGYDGGFTVTVDPTQSRSKGYTGIEDSSFRIYYKDNVDFSGKTGLVFQWARANGTFYDTTSAGGTHRTYVKQ